MKLSHLQEAKYHRKLPDKEVRKAYKAIYKQMQKEMNNDVTIDPTIHPSFERDFYEIDLLVDASSEQEAHDKIEQWAQALKLPYTGIAPPNFGADDPFFTSAIGYEFK